MSIANLSAQQLRHAANLKEQIAGLEKQLAAIFGADTTVAPATAKPAKKGGMSAAGRARIAATAKLRWAKVRAAKTKPAAVKTAVKAVIAAKPVSKPAKKKFTMSAAAKAKLSALAKARWAKIKSAKK